MKKKPTSREAGGARMLPAGPDTLRLRNIQVPHSADAAESSPEQTAEELAEGEEGEDAYRTTLAQRTATLWARLPMMTYAEARAHAALQIEGEGIPPLP